MPALRQSDRRSHHANSRRCLDRTHSARSQRFGNGRSLAHAPENCPSRTRLAASQVAKLATVLVDSPSASISVRASSATASSRCGSSATCVPTPSGLIDGTTLQSSVASRAQILSGTRRKSRSRNASAESSLRKRGRNVPDRQKGLRGVVAYDIRSGQFERRPASEPLCSKSQRERGSDFPRFRRVDVSRIYMSERSA